MGLPTTYQEVEWIGRNGNNYIVLSHSTKWSKVTEIQVGYKIEDSSYRYFICGQYYNNVSGSFSTEINSGDVSADKARFYIEPTGNRYSNNSLNLDEFNDIKFKWSGTNLTMDVNGTITSSTIGSRTNNNYNLYLFIDPPLRRSTFSHDSAISYFRIYEDGDLAVNLIPCYRKSDGVIGMYDTVSDTFYTNQGSGTFSKGPDRKNGKIKKIYIGTRQVRPHVPYETQTYSYDFRSKTTAQYQNDGWTGTMSGTISSGGISGTFNMLKDTLDLTSADTITVKTTFNITQKTDRSSGTCGTRIGNSTDYPLFGGMSTSLQNSYDWEGIIFYYGTDRTSWNGYNIPIGSGYINEWTINFNSKIATVKLFQGSTLLTSMTYNLSDAQITSARTLTKLYVATDGPGVQIATIESQVEGFRS